MPDLTDDDLAELRRLHRTAQPTPWYVADNGGLYDADGKRIRTVTTQQRFIEAAVNALPGLLAKVERLREQNTGLGVRIQQAWQIQERLVVEVERLRAAAGSECEPCDGTGDCGYCEGDGCGAPGVPAGRDPGDPDPPHCADGVCTACNGSGWRAAAPASEDDDLVERLRKALMRRHADDWDMDTVSEAAHICAEAAGSPPPTPGPTPERLFEVLSDALTESGGSHVLGSDVARARNAVMALLSTPATVLWEQDTRPTDGDPAKSYIAPPLLDCPPGTHVVVTRNEP